MLTWLDFSILYPALWYPTRHRPLCVLLLPCQMRHAFTETCTHTEQLIKLDANNLQLCNLQLCHSLKNWTKQPVLDWYGVKWNISLSQDGTNYAYVFTSNLLSVINLKLYLSWDNFTWFVFPLLFCPLSSWIIYYTN